MFYLVIFLTLLTPSLTNAAYQNPTVIANERHPNGSTRLVFRFNGNAGEPAVTREYTVNPTTTAQILRNWVDSTINELDLMHSAASLAALQPGQVVPRLAPVQVPRTPKAIWREKVFFYEQVSGKGFLGQLATDLNAMKSDIETTYQAGFLNVD